VTHTSVEIISEINRIKASIISISMVAASCSGFLTETKRLFVSK